MGGELDRLVTPLGGPVDARDEACAMDSPEVAVDECVARLRAIACPVGESQVPIGVLIPRVALEERVLPITPRLDVAPIAVEHVLPRLDEIVRLAQRGFVEGIRSSHPEATSPGGGLVKQASELRRRSRRWRLPRW